VDRLNNDIGEDAVSDLLRSLRVRSTVYCRSQMGAPWGFGVPSRDVSAFHLVTEGACWLEVDDVDNPVHLGPGDVVVLMSGRGHRVRDDLSSPVEWLDDILSYAPPVEGRLRYGGSGPRTELICGGFMVEGAPASPLLAALPPVLRLEGNDPATADWLDALLTMLRVETAVPRSGADVVLARLADVVITQTIRGYLESFTEGDRPPVGGLRDPRIAKAIRLAHTNPAHPWTVDELAAEVAMSRSAFASTFRHLTGETPMRYVTRCRLALAASYLAEGGLSVFEVARRSGYDSEASLAKAFSRNFGMAPGAYRRRMKQPPVVNSPAALGDQPRDPMSVA
jgi:AraC-like DNA-binding protein